MNKSTKYIVTGALIAALYAGLTFLSNVFGLAYGQVQFRISEALTILPVFTPAAIPGLTVGCFISNIASFNPIDMVFGTMATLCAAFVTYYFRKVKIFKIPLISFLSPVFFNAAVVGTEIALFLNKGGATLTGFLTAAFFVALGEIVVCFALGIPLYFAVKNNKVLSDLL